MMRKIRKYIKIGIKQITDNNMQIVKPAVEIWVQNQVNGKTGIYKQIEKVGRVCYKSEDKITENSAEEFVNRLITAKHLAMLEHGTVYLVLDDTQNDLINFFDANAYSEVYVYSDHKAYVTTNARVLYEHNMMELLDQNVPATSWHAKRVTVHFTTQIAISRELNRHRVNSMAEQSTRYCDYSSRKFNNAIAINMSLDSEKILALAILNTCELDSLYDSLYRPKCKPTNLESEKLKWITLANRISEEAYKKLRELGCTAQEARVVLPLDTNTEVVHTAFVEDWKHFLSLRLEQTTGKVHPDMLILAQKLNTLLNTK